MSDDAGHSIIELFPRKIGNAPGDEDEDNGREDSDVIYGDRPLADPDSEYDEPDDEEINLDDSQPEQETAENGDEEEYEEGETDEVSDIMFDKGQEVTALELARPGEYKDYVSIHQGMHLKHPNRYKQAGRNRRSKVDREADLVVVANLYLKGMTQQQIAQEIAANRPYEIKRSQIANDIQEIHRRWQESYLTTINALKVRELARIDRLEAEYWSAWEKSNRDFVSLRQDKTADETMMKTKTRDTDGKETEASVLSPSFTRTKTTTKKEERVGSVAFLEGVERCIQMRIRVLGLEPSKSVTINWRKQAEAEGINPENVVNGLVEQFIAAAATGMDGSGRPGSLGQGSEPDPGL
jgi:hypothetical protein